MVKTKRRKNQKNDYRVEAVTRACGLLAAFQHDEDELRLKELAARAGLKSSTAFRILRTLQSCGFVERVHKSHYRCNVRMERRMTYRFGYACQGEDPTFSQEWSDSIIRMAAEKGIDLIVLDNGFDPETALRNVDQLIEEKVNLAIEHQFNEHIAPIISTKFLEADIPLISMGTAHPGAVYYGGNNYLAGLIGGRYLGRWARQNWRGRIDQLILLELSMVGPLLQSRLTGVEAGLREGCPELGRNQIVRLCGPGQFGPTLDLMRKHLRRTRARRILVGAVNDPCALGALRALEEAGWSEDCAVMGQGGSLEGRAELRRPGTRLVGTVAFFPEKYGEGIIRLALDILNQRPVPPAVLVKHQLLTPSNVDHFYPNDALIDRETLRNPLLRCCSVVP